MFDGDKFMKVFPPGFARDSFDKAVEQNGEALRKLAISESVETAQAMLYAEYDDDDEWLNAEDVGKERWYDEEDDDDEEGK